MADLAPHPDRILFRVHFALAETVEIFAASPDDARSRAREKFPPDETGTVTKVKRVKEKVHG